MSVWEMQLAMQIITAMGGLIALGITLGALAAVIVERRRRG